MQIPPELLARIDEAISHYPVSKQSASLPLLHLWQEHFGFISDEGIEWIAAKLELEPIQVLGLITFYPMFRRKPAGKYHIRVCRTLSCAMAGSYALKEKISKAAGIKTGCSGHDHSHGGGGCGGHGGGHGHGDPITVSEDGKYSIEFVECLASCGTGPVCMVNDDFYEAVSDEEVTQILAKYQ